MRKKTMRLMIVVTLLLMVLPIRVLAATLASPATNLTATVEGSGSGSASTGTVSMTVTGTRTSAKNGTLTLTNSGNEAAQLSFSYAATGTYDSFTVAGSSASASGTYNAELAAGASVKIYMNVPKSGILSTPKSGSVSLDNVKLEVASASIVKVSHNELGTVSVAGTTIVSGDSVTVEASGATFAASPVSGATFVGWINTEDNSVISTAASLTYVPTGDLSLKAIFASASSEACFWGSSKAYLFEGLSAAITHATSASNKTIILAASGTLSSGSYTIPSGVTLLAPFDSDGTKYTTSPGYVEDSYTKPSAYSTLTLANGAKITVANGGAISVSAKVSAKMGYAGAPTSKYGHIAMNSGSSITVQNGGKLYVWGFISGSGNVYLKSGAISYESFQVVDWRGGTASSGMLGNDNKVFPMSQYYVQNVEAPMVMESGAKVTCSMIADIISVRAVEVQFLGTSGCIFNLSSGTATKQYDGSTDRLVLDINGDFSISQTEIKLVGDLYKIKLSDYVLPISNSVTLNVNSGTLTLNQDVSLLAGTQLNIAEGGTVKLGSGKRLYVYDEIEWKNGYYVYSNAYFRPANYAHSRAYTRTNNDIVDAKILVNGTLDASEGYLYCTPSGGNICSNGSGVVKVKAGESSPILYEATQSGTSISYSSISVGAGQLKHGDGTYLTTDAAKCATYNYNGSRWVCEIHTGIDTDHTCDVCGFATACADSNDHKCDVCGDTISECADNDGDSLCDICGASLCTHEGMTPAEAKPATCEDPGNYAYWYCADCQTYFKDEAGTAMFTEEDPYIIPALTHKDENPKDHICDNGCEVYQGTHADGDDNDHLCDYCNGTVEGDVCVDNNNDHNCDECGTSISVCVDEGKDHKCDICGKNVGTHEAAQGTHICAYCNQKASDCDYTVRGDIVTEANCVTNAVYKAKCSVCGTVSETETIEGDVDPKAHNLMDIPAQTATCTQIGWNAYQKCQNEGCNYSTYVEIPMLEHDYADTWSFDGSGHWHECKNCTATTDATTHTEAEAVKENEIPPTYNTTGYYASVVYCSVCNYEISRAIVTEPMLQGVAKVGNTNYGTLADAVEAAEDGQTVTLLTDAELTERLTVKKKIVLDLSGKTITADFTDDFGAIYIGTSGDLTVTGNGTVLSMQDIIFANYGKITIENGTFKSEGETYNAALYNMYHSGDVYGTATIKGGNFETDVWNSGMLTVEDGTLEGIDNSGKTVITGGTVNGEILNGDGSDAPDLAEKGTIAISGGTFANAVDQTWCAEGYGPTDNGDGTYGVHLHTAGTAAKENVVAATCTTDGSYDTVVRCTQCYAVLSTQTTVVGKLNHEDPNNDGDHICDHEGCNAVVTTCGDSDKDHICDTDSACTAYSTGENAHGDGDDANHTCDYCSGTVEGEVCTDNNSDHKCDECGQTMSQCSDEDADHDCDVCGATMGTHEAAEGKHTCDYCGQTVTQCSDEDTDHDCDVCGATMGTHEAAEGKHTCDYCGQTVTQCSDSDDTDHKCDTCGQDNITDHVYGEVTYTGDGINSYAAERSCACGEKQTASVTITSAVTREATCTAEGETTYTADFAEDWAQDKTTTETIAKKPHTYGDLAWSWTGSDETGYTAATATFQCSCGDTQTETDDQLEKVTTDATYEAAGSDVYTAKVTFEGKEYTDTKMVTIPQLTAKVIYGDVDGDGYVTSIDATQVLLYVAQKIQEIRVTEADVDGDANITSMDATEILLYVAKKITEFTVEKAK